MAETAAHLVDHVFPLLPVRQWVLAVPKRLHIFLSVVERCLRDHSPACPRHRKDLGDQWPLHFGKPTLVIEASQHRIGIGMDGPQEF